MTDINRTKAGNCDAFWDALGRPVRTISPSRQSVTGRVVTRKSSAPQPVESSLEQDFLTLLEFDRSVIQYGVQPLTIEWRDAQRRRRTYTPDVLARFQEDPPHLYEVKPRAVLRREWRELRPRFRQAVAVSRANGWGFKIMTETEIRTPHLANARFLLGYTRSKVDPDGAADPALERAVRLTVARMGQSRPSELLETITSERSTQALLLPWLWNAVLEGWVGADLETPLTMSSRIWSLDTEFTRRRLEET